ncbi:MAG: hypothetical protein ACI9CZ_000664 [Flavobacterium sp.]|jgi:hypothetical protein
MKHLYFTLLVTAITITSCRNNDTATVQANPGFVVPFYQQSSSAVQGQSTQASGIQNSKLQTDTSTMAGINPPHGQANHRCDIAVGAPLNTDTNGGTSLQPAQAVTSPQNVSAKTITAKGMNPPHGESNHRCDIAVGAPLNSTPTPTPTPPAPTKNENSGQETKEYTVNQAVPALLSTAADTETPAGMNPAHGKTGHRCDIAVGEPLSKS